MKFRTILLSSVFSMVIIGGVNAAELVIHDNDNINYSSDQEFNSSGLDVGITANDTTGSITTTSNITSDQNLLGIYTQENANITITGNNNGTSNLSTSNNDSMGILVYTGSELKIVNMSIYASNNDSGIEAINDGKIKIENTIGQDLWIRANDNISTSSRGIQASSSLPSRYDASVIINNMNIETNRNVTGIYSDNQNAIEITGNGNTSIISKYNSKRGISASNKSSLTITDMNIDLSENNENGFVVNVGAKANITGNGSNVLIVKENDLGGILVKDLNTELNIKDMNIETSDNFLDGMRIENEGKLSIIGNGTNSLIAKNNNDMAVDGHGVFTTGLGTKVEIEGMNIDVSNNGSLGITASTNSVVEIEGSADGSNILIANENRNSSNAGGVGIRVRDGVNSQMTINNMNIKANDNGIYGLYTSEGGKLNITGVSSGANTLQANNNANLGAGIAASNANSEISLTDMNIEANGNGLYGVFAEYGGKINISSTQGKSWIRANNNTAAYTGKGIFSLGVTSDISITDMNIDTSNNTRGIYAQDQAVLNIKSNSGNNVIISNNNHDVSNGYGIVSDRSSSLNITGMDIEVNNNKSSAFSASVGGQINIEGVGRNNLYMNNNGLAGFLANMSSAIDPTITVKHMDIYASGNTVLLSNNGGVVSIEDTTVNISDDSKLGLFNQGTGTFNATNSKLMNNIYTNTSGGATSFVNLDNVEWKNIGRSNISELNLSGINDLYMSIYFGNSTIEGGLITIEDTATSTGTNTLHITSAGGDGTMADAIVINQENATTKLSDTDFTLANVVDSGFYEYDHLGMDGNDNIVLQSNGVMTDTAKTISQFPALHLNIIKTGMNELRKRLGDLRENSPYVSNGAWVRTYAKHLDVNEKIDAKMNLYGMEAGYDYQIYSTCENKAYIGAMAGYLYTDNIKITQKNGKGGNGHAKTPSVGLYGTWLNNQGWFADATTRYFWSDMKATNQTSTGEVISYKPDRDFITASIEGGKRFEYVLTQNEKYVIEPKAEFQYAHAKAKSFSTSNNLGVHYGKTESKALRVGSSFGYEKHLDNGSVIEPFIEINAVQEFDGKTNIRYSGAYTKSDISGFSIEVGGGLNAKLNDNWNIYSDVMYEKGSVVKAISTNLGVRYNW